MLGSLLPDILFKIQLISNLVDIPKYKLYWFLAPLHTPLGCLLATFLIIFLFKYPRKRTFLLVTLGWISHLLSDMITKYLFLGQSMLLFPFSWKNYGFNLFWPEQFYIPLLILLFIYIYVRILKRFILKNKRFKTARLQVPSIAPQ